MVIAPDSLKDSCSAAEAAEALAKGVRMALRQRVRVRQIPMADGGEGTLDALVAAWAKDRRGGYDQHDRTRQDDRTRQHDGTRRDGEYHRRDEGDRRHGNANNNRDSHRAEDRHDASPRILSVPTMDALGRPRVGRIGLSPDGRTAIVEAAEANGLPHVADLPPRPLDADTAGVGALVRAALEAGAWEILLCIGGSATSDGGAGLLRSLGVRLLDEAGDDIAPGARGLLELDRIDSSGLLPAARDARWRIAVDVDNPLVGPRGAAAVFGPQKGASPEDVALIDAGLARLADVLAEAAGPAASAAELRDRPGLGAAGGLALGPVALLGADTVPGAELVAQALDLDRAIGESRLVITGEGRLDAQSLDGKVVSRVVEAAPEGVPVVVVAGSLALTATECREAGIAAAFSIADGPETLAGLSARAPELLAETAAHVCAIAAASGPLAEAGTR